VILLALVYAWTFSSLRFIFSSKVFDSEAWITRCVSPAYM